MNLKNNASSFNIATFPVDPATCKNIMPWDYLGDNTIFQVIHNAGLRTAWSDKHAVYMSFNGPGSNGQSIDDYFGPEIDSQAVEPNGVPYPQDDDWAHIEAATKQYDGYKVQAVLNEINGLDHSGRTHVGTPAIFGMNFQAVSVAEKIRMTPATLIGPDANGNYTTSTPEPGGYQWVNGRLVPGPVLSSALDYVDAQLGRMVSQIHKDGLAGSTTIIVTAKHGQSPQDPNKLVTVEDGPIISAINAAWAQTHPNNTSLIVAGTDDDLWQSYLSDNSQAACDFVKSYLWNHTAQGDDVNKNPVTVQHSGLAQIWAGARAAKFFGVPVDDGRYPDVFGKVQEGIVYSGPTKLAEHGGMNVGDRHVLMIVSGAGIPARVVSRLGRDHPGRADDPGPAGAQPRPADGRSGRGHASPSWPSWTAPRALTRGREMHPGSLEAPDMQSPTDRAVLVVAAASTGRAARKNGELGQPLGRTRLQASECVGKQLRISPIGRNAGRVQRQLVSPRLDVGRSTEAAGRQTAQDLHGGPVGEGVRIRSRRAQLVFLGVALAGGLDVAGQSSAETRKAGADRLRRDRLRPPDGDQRRLLQP